MKNTATTSTNEQETVMAPDCERVTTILDQIIIGQDPSAEDEDYFINHAEDCSPCFDSIGKQRIFVDFLAQHISHRGAPSSLSQTILARVKGEMA